MVTNSDTQAFNSLLVIFSKFAPKVGLFGLKYGYFKNTHFFPKKKIRIFPRFRESGGSKKLFLLSFTKKLLNLCKVWATDIYTIGNDELLNYTWEKKSENRFRIVVNLPDFCSKKI